MLHKIPSSANINPLIKSGPFQAYMDLTLYSKIILFVK